MKGLPGKYQPCNRPKGHLWRVFCRQACIPLCPRSLMGPLANTERVPGSVAGSREPRLHYVSPPLPWEPCEHTPVCCQQHPEPQKADNVRAHQRTMHVDIKTNIGDTEQSSECSIATAQKTGAAVRVLRAAGPAATVRRLLWGG